MRPYRKSILFGVGLFLVDAFFLNQGFLSLFVILLTLFFFLPRALWALRRDKFLFRQRMAKAGIYLLAAVAVLVTNALQNRMADRRAIELGNVCLAYHAKYNRYPQRLDELVPEFIPSVPVAKYTLAGASFFYLSRPTGGEPMLFYEAMPPFGRRFYHMEKGYWGFLD